MSDIDENVEKQRLIQEKLAQARALLVDVGRLANDGYFPDIQFMGLTYDPSFGWYTEGGELVEASEWNSSGCSIGLEDKLREWNSSGCVNF